MFDLLFCCVVYWRMIDRVYDSRHQHCTSSCKATQTCTEMCVCESPDRGRCVCAWAEGGGRTVGTTTGVGSRSIATTAVVMVVMGVSVDEVIGEIKVVN